MKWRRFDIYRSTDFFNGKVCCFFFHSLTLETEPEWEEQQSICRLARRCKTTYRSLISLGLRVSFIFIMIASNSVGFSSPALPLAQSQRLRRHRVWWHGRPMVSDGHHHHHHHHRHHHHYHHRRHHLHLRDAGRATCSWWPFPFEPSRLSGSLFDRFFSLPFQSFFLHFPRLDGSSWVTIGCHWVLLGFSSPTRLFLVFTKFQMVFYFWVG